MSAKEPLEQLQNARIIPALVTPFQENGQINLEHFLSSLRIYLLIIRTALS